MYEKGLIQLKSKDEYQRNVIEFLRYLDSDCAVARLVGRAPKEETIFCNWDRSWRLIRDEIVSYMEENFIKQGDKNIKIIYEKIKGDKL